MEVEYLDPLAVEGKYEQPDNSAIISMDPSFEFDFGAETDLESLLKTMSPDGDDIFSSIILDNPLGDDLPPLEQENSQTSCDSSPAPMLVPIKQEPGTIQEIVPETKYTRMPAHKKARKDNSSRNGKKSTSGSLSKSEKQREANKLSAQASRQRKKDLKDTLEKQVEFLTQTNSDIDKEILELQTENRVLRDEYLQLQKTISNSMARPIQLSAPNSPIILGDTPAESQKPAETMPQQNMTMTPEQQQAAVMYMLLMLQQLHGVSAQALLNLMPMMTRLEIRH